MYDLDRFIAEADEIAARGYSDDAVAAIVSRLARLAEDSDGFEREDLSALHGSAADAKILARGERGSVLMLGRFPHEAATPVHNHNSWGVVYVVSGRDRYERWHLEDADEDAGRAAVAQVDVVELSAGDWTSFPPPPQDLHAQQGIDAPAMELVFFAADPNSRPRAYFDPEQGTVSYEEAMR